MRWHRTALGYWRLTNGPYWLADVGDPSACYPRWIVYALQLGRGPDLHIGSGPEVGAEGKAAVEDFLRTMLGRLAWQ